MSTMEKYERSSGKRASAGARSGNAARRTPSGTGTSGTGNAARRTPSGTGISGTGNAVRRTSSGAGTSGTGNAVRRTPSGTGTSGTGNAVRRAPSGTGTSVTGNGVRRTPSGTATSGAGNRPGNSQARARAAAKRRRRRRRQQKMILTVLVLFIAAAAVVCVLGIRSLKKGKDQKALRADAIVSMESGDYNAAIEKFDEALGLSGKKVGKFEIDVLQQRAEAEYKSGDYTAALHTWQLLMEEDEAKEAYKEGAVLCLAELGNYDEALQQGVLESYVYNRMALDQINSGAYDQALETIARGMQSEDTSAREDLAYNQAVVYENKGDFAKALELFEAYAAQYGTDSNVEREITFLKTRSLE